MFLLLATSEMILDMEVQAVTGAIEVSWGEPRFPPLTLELTFLCAEFWNYAIKDSMTFDVTGSHEFHFMGQKPGTKCEVTLLAKYNVANINDQGIHRTITTPTASKHTHNVTLL